ncbi:RHS repeat-associated core domain-containing protein [Stenotrophomonas bentonitica]|uniref:RHS repeat-associated core domain-containing protein n=1 Tax=Stenotrophomonas bentonitica TaxID=1450134 RepID=UPI00345E1BA0
MNCKRIFAALRSSAVGVFCLALLLLARPASAQTVTYYHTDPLGSVVAETDAAGNVTKRYDYEPYGAVVGGQVEDGPGYTGHVSDASTGLSYMQQRYMDPQLGVFLSVDPVTAYQQPVDQFNRYRYANGNPYSFTDRDGRSATLVAPWVILPIIVATTYVVATPEQRKQAGEWVDRGIRRLFQRSESSDASSDAGTAQPGDADSAEGCIYCVDGSKTESGRDYVGSTDDMRRRERDASDGRDRSGAERIGSYAKGDREGRRNQEQQAINDRGVKGELDNKRNEVSPAKWEERNIKPPEG